MKRRKRFKKPPPPPEGGTDYGEDRSGDKAVRGFKLLQANVRVPSPLERGWGEVVLYSTY